MSASPKIPGWKDKVLFTPGPLTTSQTVKQAMLRDLGSRDFAFMSLIKDIRRKLLEIADAPPSEFVAVPMQGSGTFGVESVIGSVLPPDGKILVVINGAYGKRMAHIAKMLKIETTTLVAHEYQKPNPALVGKALSEDPTITHVAAVHCETTTGIVNPIEEIGREARAHRRLFIVDAMSSFGAIPVNIAAAKIDYLISSANKCIEGTPGFSFAIANREALESCAGYARSVSLDLYSQWKVLDQTGQFRFTPPTHAILAFAQALVELEAEGGVAGRGGRYRDNYETLVAGMRAIGFEEYLRPEDQGPIITSFRCPDHPRFTFENFYERLNDRGYVIYPGKVSDADCFRIGHVGRIFPSDVRDLLAAIRDVLGEMGVTMKAKARS